MPRRLRRTFLTVLCSAVFLGAGSASASAATQWVALTGSVGANTSCASPGYIGVTGVNAAIDTASSGDTIHICGGTWNTVDSAIDGFQWYDKDLTIEGNGQSKTIIDGTGSTLTAIAARTDSFASVDLTVRDLTIQNALAEAPSAVWAMGPLTIEDAKIQNNQSGTASVGMDVAGASLTIRRSTLTGETLGAEYPAPLVYSLGSTTIEQSTLANNSLPYPVAGIQVNGPDGTDLTVDSSTFSGLSTACISALFNSSGGGTDSVTSITNSTFTGNATGDTECPSGHILVGGLLVMRNSTFAGNDRVRTGSYGDGEIMSYGGLTLGNNIIAADPEAQSTCAFEGPAVNDFGNVISDDSVGCDDFVGGPSPSPQAKVPVVTIDLQALADNGGPTDTMALGAASVARGAAIKASCPATDQRGYQRDSACDSGAYEYGASPGGKPRVKQKGRAGAKSLRVRVRCGGSAPCRIKLTGVLEGGGGKLEQKTVKVGGKGKTVTLKYTGELKRSLIAAGGSGKVRVRAREVGGGSATTVVRVSLPDSVTG